MRVVICSVAMLVTAGAAQVVVQGGLMFLLTHPVCGGVADPPGEDA